MSRCQSPPRDARRIGAVDAVQRVRDADQVTDAVEIHRDDVRDVASLALAVASPTSRKAYAFTAAALLARGAGVVSIQWLIRNSDPSVPPRFGRQLKSSGFRNV